MRQFDTGATRDDADDKPDYVGYLSPLVIRRYGEYMLRHQKQADGTMRGSDNWKAGFGDDHEGVCLSSAWRHFLDLWLEHEGYDSRDGFDEAMCGLLFNLMAYYHARLNDEE